MINVKNLKNKINKSKKDIIKSKDKIIKSIKKNKVFKTIKSKKIFKNIRKNLTIETIAISVLLIIMIIIISNLAFNFIFQDSESIAVVNGQKISTEELNEKYDFFFFLAGYPEEYKELLTKEAFLDQLVNEKILLQEASKKDISISQDKVEETIASSMKSNQLSEEEFIKLLTEKGFSMDNLKNYYNVQLILTELINEVFTDINVSDKEIQDYYNKNLISFRAQTGQRRISHILVETKEEAEEVLKELKKGMDFAELAKEISIGPSSSRGGDLGFVSKGQMVKEFEDVAFKLNVNQLSSVVQTQFGYHILKRDSDKIDYSEAKIAIVEILKVEKQKEAFTKYMDLLLENSEIELFTDDKELVDTKNEIISDSNDSCYSSEFSSDTVIFYHADWCPHCRNMIPIVEELEKEGYKFHSAESTSGEGVAIVTKCFSDVIQGSIPQFICAGTKVSKLGELSKSALKEFAENCN